MKVLAIDTTSPQGSVALVDEEELLAEVRIRSGTAGHSTTVVPAIEFVLRTVGLELTAVDGFGVAVGPGSFTGIRVGISTVQGLALSGRRRCVGVTTLDALAAKIAGEAACLVSVIDAFRGDVYGAVYDRDGRPTAEPGVQRPEDLLAHLPDGEAAFVGDGVPLVSGKLAGFAGIARFPRCSSYLAASIGKLAAARMKRDEGGPPTDLRPLYIRSPTARLQAR